MTKPDRGLKDYILLHLLFLQLSLGGIASKAAAQRQLFSIEWVALFGLSLLNLFIYMLFWQQILKKFPLSTAYINKASTIIWSALWGYLFFDEIITLNMFIGAIIVIVGLCLVVSESE